MQERRTVLRHRALKRGSIWLPNEGAIDCRVRTLSSAGASLEVASQLGIPDEFVLVIEHDHLKQACHVVWRHGDRIGVEFAPPPPGTSAAPE